MFGRSTFVPALALCVAAPLGVLSATLTFDCAKVPNICSNDCYAIQCLGKPSTLHRDSANASTRRQQTACQSPNRCSGNPTDSNSCDEYPYASSIEGGAGSATRCVPSAENSSQGGSLSSFYRSAGVADGDAYNVAFKGSSGLQYCSGSCTNSGNELVKRYPVATQYNRREFETEDGETILMFEPVGQRGLLDSVVGTDAFLGDEERSVKIVKAL
ncbi:uncharacterized protein PFL1_00414 [Pseudozyma flocculosa PF-1]|uniref:Deoxyribonuclease NucA/NucB domain-containing protein n=1 Tax=Pseudozyma flocculosa TaxID=84751 RepID=A0A5C3ERI2_9BASI|nr:uncharacterized protein PFL1_00414 [Pseudozyma flocculosa PF-1]EPQ32217.1 hypothetical protein PFL1_00414 [Pseudozyma flocculosa PF-1]SPO34838.1 uncharacterized protein PSFLO_00309 [Pseudozyma flocculosa]